MTSREPSNPVVRRLAAAINDGGRGAFLATLTPDATLTGNGNPQSLRDWIDREIFSARGHMNVEREPEGRHAGVPQRNPEGQMQTVLTLADRSELATNRPRVSRSRSGRSASRRPLPDP